MPFEPSDIFQCTNCGDCCKGYGGTFVSEEDIQQIAAFLQIDKERFATQYCRLSGGKRLIAQGQNGYCAFWDHGCRIHPVKPRMCRIWPFIQGVARDVTNWQVMAGECPGIRADIPDSVVLTCVNRVLNEMP